MNYRIFALFVLFCFLKSFSIDAQTKNYPVHDYGSVIFSPFAGGHFFQDGQRYPQNTASSELNDKFALGLRLGMQAHRLLDLEATLKYVPADNNFGRVNLFFYHFDGLFNIPVSGRIVPFVNFGLGAATIKPAAVRSQTQFLMDYGAGVKVFILRNLAFRLDVRGYTYFDRTFTNLNIDAGFVYYARVFGAIKDSDGDGYPDREDLCPYEPENFNGYLDEDGCPDTIKPVPTDGFCE